MEKEFQLLCALFNGNKPTVKVFRDHLAKLPEGKRISLLRDTYRLTMSYWLKLPPEYQAFMKALIKNNRQAWLDFVLRETILGELRYTLQRPDLFIALMKIIELTCRTHRISIDHLAMSTLLAFSFSQKVSTLGEYFQKAILNIKKAMELIGKYIYEDNYDL